MRKITFCTIFAALMLTALPALAQTVTVENNTASKLVELYISNADTNSWEGNVLKDKALAPGQSFEVTFDGKYIVYDLKAVFDDGREQPYYGINVRKFNYVRLNPDKVEAFN
ncbi:hypothetical protein LJB99_05775 [Deltaproteobacteria bacterium OttesenSCG-928-K17]|nr:hypothetical protein [Deltaproteobacteria bacterium OttesenSCG-928-K17]